MGLDPEIQTYLLCITTGYFTARHPAVYLTSPFTVLVRHTRNNTDPILTSQPKLFHVFWQLMLQFVEKKSLPLLMIRLHFSPIAMTSGSLGAAGITSNWCPSGGRVSWDSWWGHGPLHRQAGLSTHARGPSLGLSTQDNMEKILSVSLAALNEGKPTRLL